MALPVAICSSRRRRVASEQLPRSPSRLPIPQRSRRVRTNLRRQRQRQCAARFAKPSYRGRRDSAELLLRSGLQDWQRRFQCADAAAIREPDSPANSKFARRRFRRRHQRGSCQPDSLPKRIPGVGANFLGHQFLVADDHKSGALIHVHPHQSESLCRTCCSPSSRAPRT
jgi:hypothetical protein